MHVSVVFVLSPFHVRSNSRSNFIATGAGEAEECDLLRGGGVSKSVAIWTMS